MINNCLQSYMHCLLVPSTMYDIATNPWKWKQQWNKTQLLYDIVKFIQTLFIYSGLYIVFINHIWKSLLLIYFWRWLKSLKILNETLMKCDDERNQDNSPDIMYACIVFIAFEYLYVVCYMKLKTWDFTV